MSYQQILRGNGTNLSVTFYGNETPTDADGDVTVTITNAAGETVVDAATTSHGAADSGQYSYALAGQTDLDYLTVVWSGTFGGLDRSQTDYVEVVGGFLYTLAELRASDSSLRDTDKFPSSLLAASRITTMDEIDSVCRGWSFVPRYARATVSGLGDDNLLLPHLHVTRIRSVTVDGTAFTDDEVADIKVTETGQLLRGSGVFTKGERNIVVAYEHGLEVTPPDVGRVAKVLNRYRLNQPYGGISDRATQFVSADNGTFRLDTGAVDKTGIPDVDAVLARYPALISVA